MKGGSEAWAIGMDEATIETGIPAFGRGDSERLAEKFIPVHKEVEMVGFVGEGFAFKTMINRAHGHGCVRLTFFSAFPRPAANESVKVIVGDVSVGPVSGLEEGARHLSEIVFHEARGGGVEAVVSE